MALLLVPAVAGAKTYRATTVKDKQPNGCTGKSCTVREALIAANHHAGKDTVVLPSRGPYKLQIAPTGNDDETTGDLDVTDPVNITHPGKGNATIDARKIDRVLFADIPPSSTEVYTKLSRITITGGKTTGFGGGLSLGQALLGLDHSKVTGNRGGSGGGIFAAQGELTLVDSTVSDNTGTGQGGGINSNVETAIRGSTISGNHSLTGDGGGLAYGSTELKMTNTTVAGNSAASSGGGIASFGAGTLNDVTITANRADSDNAAGGMGGGLFSDNVALAVSNSIAAGNTVGSSGTDPNCSGAVSSHGHNLVVVSSGCTGFTAPGDFGANPKLGKLAHNGGPTKTVALMKGSPAIGKAKKTTSEKRDQRGRKRDKHPDIGAYERGAKP